MTEPFGNMNAKSVVETDSTEFSPLIKDLNRGTDFRRETIAYLIECLSKEKLEELSAISNNPVITCFEPVGKAISKDCTNRKSINRS